jgi:hypothetical protein
VHLQRSRSRNDDSSIGLKAADPTLDVAELLHAHVCSEPALGEHVPDMVGGVALFNAG